MRRFHEPPSQHPLQRLDKYHQHEKQYGGRGFRRKERLQPSADAADQTQIKQRQKRRGDRIKQIFLPSDLQKVMPPYEIYERCEGQNGQQSKRSREPLSGPRFQTKWSQVQAAD